jgi:23S rRNA pseudouridine1911/1915/1917 synthase
MSGTVKEFHFTVEQAGIRLDKYISERCSDLSRTQAQKLIEGGQVTVNGNPEKASYKLSAGDTVLVKIPPPAPTHLTPEDIPGGIDCAPCPGIPEPHPGQRHPVAPHYHI